MVFQRRRPIGFWATISTLAISFYLASRSIYSFLLISAQVEKVKVPVVYIRLRAILLTVYFALYLCAFYFLVVVFERLWLIVVAFLAVLLFMCMYHALSFYHRPDDVWHLPDRCSAYVPSSSWALL